MTIYNGSSAVSNGLVFAYDMGNTQKSWRGKPTTNTCSFGSYNFIDGNATVTRNTTAPVPPPITGYEIAKLQSNDGSEVQTILYTAAVDQVNGGVYTHSAYIYLDSGTFVRVGQHWNPWDYGTYHYIPTKTWTRVSYTLTNATNNYGNVACSYNTNGVIYITATQYELGSFATPFVGGTRSNTQAILDLAGNITTTAVSLTYESNGTFRFNGSSDYIDATPSSGLTGTGSWTMESIFKIDGAPSNVSWQNVIVDTDPTGGSANMIAVDYGGVHGGSQNQLLYTSRPSTGGNYTTLFGPVLTQGVYYHVSVVRNSTTDTRLYVNGVLNNTYSGNIPTATQPLVRVGRWSDGTNYANATIPLVRIYNRALSAGEVRQNFDAFRTRFGI